MTSAFSTQALLRGRYVRGQLVGAVREEYERTVAEIEGAARYHVTIRLARLTRMRAFFCTSTAQFIGQGKEYCVSLNSLHREKLLNIKVSHLSRLPLNCLKRKTL